MVIFSPRRMKSSALAKIGPGKNVGQKPLVRVQGIEPWSQAWEARVLPLNDTRID
jgi:hypothetical protein